MVRIFIICFALFCFSHTCHAGKIAKGFGALEMYNYFEAKRLFEKSLKKRSVPAAYGLSLIYYRTDNPFHNIDSAYKFIVVACNGFSALTLKERSEYEVYGVDSLTMEFQRELISGVLFANAVKKNSVDAFDFFIQQNYWSCRIDSAVFMRDSLAFEQTDQDGTSAAYAQFMNEYPTSVFVESASSRYEHQLYLESTASNTLISYLEFVKKYPANPYKTDAEDKIFEIYTETGSVQSFKKFIEDCPANHNVDKAWRQLYNAHIQTNSYSEGSIAEFSSAFPQYPYMEELDREMTLTGTEFYPFKSNDYWGYVDQDGTTVIDPKFEEAEFFFEGLAVVKMDEKYGYINKSNKVVIDPVYEDALAFNEGHAVVEYKGKLGMINRNGEFIISPKFEDLGNLNNGLTYFLKDSLYGYFDSKGIERIPPKYSEAFDFIEGKAIVSLNDNYGLIDVFGTTYIPMKYEELRRYDATTYLARLNNNWGLISIQGDTILPFEYDYVGELNCRRAIVEKDGVFNYVDPRGILLLTNWLPVYSEYRQLAQFKNGYAKIYNELKYNLIDTTGKKLFLQPKENIGDYSSLIAYSKAGKWGYINSSGTQIIPCNFTYGNSFIGNYAITGADPFFGLINKTGQYIIQPYYEELYFLNDSLLVAESRGNLGLLNTKGDTLLNFVYLKIEPINEKVVKIEQGGDVFYYDLVRNSFLRKEEN